MAKIELYVKNDDNLIYQVVNRTTIPDQGKDNHLVDYWNLELVCGRDYTNPDENDNQGWVSANNFTQHVQTESITVFPMDESLKDRLEEEGYKVVEKPKNITIRNIEE